MTPTELLTQVKKSIGKSLLYLRNASRYPDNYFYPTDWVKKMLSLDLKWKAKLYRLYPELLPKWRSRQMRLSI